MGWTERGAVIALWVITGCLSMCAPVSSSLVLSNPRGAVSIQAFQQQPFEQEVGSVTTQTIRELRRWLRRTYGMLTRSMVTWGKWLRRSAFYVGIAVLFLLADGGLLSAWRRDGLRILRDQVPLVLYVYARLLVAPRVAFLAKVLLLLAILYGVRRRDLIPDRGLVGRLDDIVIIAIATRAFVYTCPEKLVNSYAESAINWRRRMIFLQRAQR